MSNGDVKLNGEFGILAHKIDEVCKQIVKLENKQDKYHGTSQESLNQMQMQTALLQQAHDTLESRVGKNEREIERNDFWTKIIGAITAILILVGGVIAAVSQVISASPPP